MPSKDIRIRGGDAYAAVAQLAPSLDQEQRRLVAQALDDASADFGSDELAYVRAKIGNKVKIASQSSSAWVRQMADGYRLLYGWLERQMQEMDCLERDDVRFAGSTIFYFINPFDVIPDHQAGIGFSDDALALHLCTRNLPGNWTDNVIRD